MRGHVYAIEIEGGLIKFGFTTNLRHRFLALRRENGSGMRPLGVATGELVHERELHGLLNAFRVGPETFVRSPLVMMTVEMMAPWPAAAIQEPRPYRRQFWPGGSPNLVGTLQ